MTITNKAFRRTEAMLLAAKFPSTDVLMSVIGLALEAEDNSIELDADIEPAPISISLQDLADHLGWSKRTTRDLLRQADGETFGDLGFRICSENDGSSEGNLDEGCKNPDGILRTSLKLSEELASIIRGTALTIVHAGNEGAMIIDADSNSVLDLITKLAVVGGGLLYRETETADERTAELMSVAATIAARSDLEGRVVVHCRRNYKCPTAQAALVAAVLQDAAVITMIDPILELTAEDSWLDEDESENRLSTRNRWQSLTTEGARLTDLLPHAPIAVLVPVPRDAKLSPKAACAFVTAAGPLRRDRASAVNRLHEISNGRLGQESAGRLADIWENRPERARTGLEAIRRMIDIGSRVLPGEDPMLANQGAAYAALAITMSGGIAPHVWSPSVRQTKPNARRFHRELFVSEPDANLLFSKRLRDEPGVRLLLFGPPGTGKTAAAENIAANVLGMASHDVRMSDVLFHRLGELERAISSAFRSARENNLVLIFDEADSIAGDRAAVGTSAVHLVTAMTNQLLLELDRHDLPIIFCTNFSERIDPAVRRRVDMAFEVKPIPSALERRALNLLLKVEPPDTFSGFGGDTVVADYASATRIARLQGGGEIAAVAAVRRARDLRLGRQNSERRRIGF